MTNDLKARPMHNYEVKLNWKGEVHTVYTHAYTPNQARRNAIQKLSVKLRMAVAFVAKAVNEVTVKPQQEKT